MVEAISNLARSQRQAQRQHLAVRVVVERLKEQQK